VGSAPTVKTPYIFVCVSTYGGQEFFFCLHCRFLAMFVFISALSGGMIGSFAICSLNGVATFVDRGKILYSIRVIFYIACPAASRRRIKFPEPFYIFSWHRLFTCMKMNTNRMLINGLGCGAYSENVRYSLS
jgi:hypothetical protein